MQFWYYLYASLAQRLNMSFFALIRAYRDQSKKKNNVKFIFLFIFILCDLNWLKIRIKIVANLPSIPSQSRLVKIKTRKSLLSFFFVVVLVSALKLYARNCSIFERIMMYKFKRKRKYIFSTVNHSQNRRSTSFFISRYAKN